MKKKQAVWRAAYKKAKDAFQLAEKTYMGFAGSDYDRRERYLRSGFERSCEYYLEAMDLLHEGVPVLLADKVRFYYRAANAFACAYRLDEAWMFLARAEELRGQKNDISYYLQGYLNLQAGQYEMAVVCFDKSLCMYDVDNTTTAYTLCKKAIALYALKDYAAAYECISDAVTIEHRKTIFWEVYADCALAVGDAKQAERGKKRYESLLNKIAS